MRTLLEFYIYTQIGGLNLNVLTFALLLIGCWIYALSQGGAPERIGALILLVGYALTVVVVSPPFIRYRSVETGVLMVDLLCFASFVLLAMRAERYWPLWIGALQLLTVAGHGAKFVASDMLGNTYAFLIVVWSYPMIFLLIIGTWRHQRRLRRFGVDESWSPNLRPS